MASLNFKGKSAVWNHHLSVPYHTLDKDNEKSLKGNDDSENLIIEADNLFALKSLLPKYQGKIDCIYIDPPYNTGEEGWAYNDNVNSPLIKDWLGKTVDKDDLTKHDKWLCMMTPRLKLLRELLSEDGAIFISIDDHEVHRLRSVLDEIFGEINFVTQIEWQKRYTRSNNTDDFTSMVEHIVVYGKSISFKPNLLSRTEDANDRYTNPDNDKRGPWKPMPFFSQASPAERRNLCYEIINPFTKEKIIPVRKAWRSEEAVYREYVANEKVYWGKDGSSKFPSIKSFLSEAREGMTPINFWSHDFAGNTDDANAEIKEIFGDKIFDTPKPSSLIKLILQTASKKDSVILDCFAGSGTTAHAVIEQNKDGGNRKYILVQLSEEIEKSKPAYRLGYRNVVEITRERVKRVIEKNKFKTGFTYYTLGQSIDADSIIAGKLPTYEEFAKYVFYLATGKNYPDKKTIDEKEFFVGTSNNESIYLLYRQNLDSLKSLAITLDWADKINKKDSGKKIVYAPACFLDDEHLEEFSIQFVSIPYNLFEKK